MTRFALILAALAALAACGHVQTPHNPGEGSDHAPAVHKPATPPAKCAPCGVPGRRP